ncbi:MAG: 4Fe-4S binding protein [Actinobacteria bacterium]|nr:4Fe-4S binding protein [Actinomycetota bacterium]
MGHIGHLNEEYRALADRLQHGPVAMPEPDDEAARAGWREILEILFTPEEAAVASRMPLLPITASALAGRMGMAVGELEPRLEALADKGVVMDIPGRGRRDTSYLLAPPVVGFFEFSMMRAQDSIPKERMARALDAYTAGDDSFAREVFGSRTVVGRTLVHESGVAAADLPEVLDWERASEVVGAAAHHAVSICYCRHKAQHLGHACDRPADICLTLNGGADYVIRRGFGRAVERTEALDLLVQARELGLVHIADNVQERPTYICSCCACCCAQLSAIRRYDLPAVVPSGFQAESDDKACSGCGRCAKACPIGAIVMRPQYVEASPRSALVSSVDAERCIGCGVCAGACRRDAMRMVRRAEQPKIPVNTLERVVRSCLEKGRLADLIVDEGSSRGNRFIGQVVGVLTSLPAADRLLASEQLGSRFVNYALQRGPSLG